jgi:hypothetical protein
MSWVKRVSSLQMSFKRISCYTNLFKKVTNKTKPYACSDRKEFFDPRQPTKGSLIELGLEILSSLQKIIEPTKWTDKIVQLGKKKQYQVTQGKNS